MRIFIVFLFVIVKCKEKQHDLEDMKYEIRTIKLLYSLY